MLRCLFLHELAVMADAAPEGGRDILLVKVNAVCVPNLKGCLPSGTTKGELLRYQLRGSSQLRDSFLDDSSNTWQGVGLALIVPAHSEIHLTTTTH
jgi:hypothetical protein